MVFLNRGLEEVKNWFYGRQAGVPSEIILGEGNATPSETDTSLESAIASTSKQFSSISDSTYTVTYEHTLGISEGNGFAIREVGLICPTAGTAGNETVTFTRNTFPVINKSADEEMETTIKIVVDNEV